MSSHWAHGTKILSTIKSIGKESDEQNSVAQAIILFNSGKNIILFYKLREELGLQTGNPKAILKEIYDIVLEEIENSRRNTHLIVSIKREDIGLDVIRPFKMKITAGKTSWCQEENPVYVLGKTKTSPGDFGWILP
ncbi:MAG: hypothetical protein IKA17_10690 [Clostridia bacterium]|nr:hypothetical protein [Clostridia bacterium]